MLYVPCPTSLLLGSLKISTEMLLSVKFIIKDFELCFQITDACSACFEQRTVFTQQVLAKALNQMVCKMLLYCKLSFGNLSSSFIFLCYCFDFQVDQTPLPLLFMRTIIQAIDAFPTMVIAALSLRNQLAYLK